MKFDFDSLPSELKDFLKKNLPDAVNCTNKDDVLLMLDDFITSTFDENDEPTALSREGESIYDIIYCCTP